MNILEQASFKNFGELRNQLSEEDQTKTIHEHACKPASPQTVLKTLASNERLVTDLLQNFYKKKNKAGLDLKSNRFITPEGGVVKDKSLSNFEPEASMSLTSPIHQSDLVANKDDVVAVHGDFDNKESTIMDLLKG